MPTVRTTRSSRPLPKPPRPATLWQWAMSLLAALLLATAPATGAGSATAPSPAQTSPGSTVTTSHSAAAAGETTGRPFCNLWWGSLARAQGSTPTPGALERVRAGRHTCFDRLVLDLTGSPTPPSYEVRYVPSVRSVGSGRPLPLAGGADLQILVRVPAVVDGRPTLPVKDPAHLVSVTGWDTFRQVALAGTAEGQTTLGLGVRARLPFRVFVLDDPGGRSRLVVDVAHRW